MNRIDRYISGLFWSFFLGGLVVFVTIFIAVDAMSTMVNYNKVAGSALLAYYGYSAPEIIYKMVPVACLLATIFTLSSMNKANELVALSAFQFVLDQVRPITVLRIACTSESR